MSQWMLRALLIALCVHPERYHLIVIALPPHHTILHIILDRIQHILRIGNSQNLKLHIAELDGVEGVVLPGDEDSAVVDWGADFESDAVIGKKYE